MIKKMRGHSGKKNARKSRNSCRVNGRGCGCTGTVDSGPKCAQAWNQIQTLKECLCCHIYCAHHWPRLVQPLAQFLIESPGTLYGTISLLYATILWIDWYSNVLDLFRGARQHTIDSYSEMSCTSSEVSYIDWYSEMSWTSSEASRYPVTPCSALHNTCNTLI
jgi:hypothetical protein